MFTTELTKRKHYFPINLFFSLSLLILFLALDPYACVMCCLAARPRVTVPISSRLPVRYVHAQKHPSELLHRLYYIGYTYGDYYILLLLYIYSVGSSVCATDDEYAMNIFLNKSTRIHVKKEK
jgi:hypothetical protein